MRVQELMREHVKTVPATMSAFEAWNLMKRQGIRHLVVTEGRDLVGILSDRDAGGRSGGNLRARMQVGDLMTRNVITVTPETTVRRAANILRGRTIGCVPVMRGDRLVGILTVSDLLEVIGRGLDPPRRSLVSSRAAALQLHS